jgi:DNA polymerase V
MTSTKTPELTIISKLSITTDPHFIPVMLESVAAGFPSPAQDYIKQVVDLNEYLIANKRATFIVRVNSKSMLNVGIDFNDELVVDRALEAENEDIIIAVINNEMTVKTLIIDVAGKHRKVWLRAENPDFASIYPREFEEIQVWGVVTWNLKDLRRGRRKRLCLVQ